MTDELKKALVESALELLESLNYKVFTNDQVINFIQEAWENGAENGQEWHCGSYMDTIKL